MARKRSTLETAGLLLLLTAAQGLLADRAAAQSEEPLVFVISAERPERDVPKWRLLRLFKGENQFWEDGARVQVVLPPGGDEATSADLYAFLGMNRLGLRKLWVAKVFRGEAPATAMPQEPETAAELLAMLRDAPGAIGVFRLSEWRRADGRNLRALTVDGKAPGTEGYLD